MAEQTTRTRLPEDRRVVVNFHGIGDPPPYVPSDERPYWCPEVEWRSIIGVLADAAGEGTNVEITFDDGNRSDVEEALPALLEHGLSARFHVCAGRIGEAGYLDARALCELRDAGMGIGSHGWHHVDSRTLSQDELVRASRDSKDRVEAVVGIPVTTFAIPLGSYDRRVLQHLRNYSTVYTSDATSAAADAWLVPRWSYVRGWTERTVSDLAHGVESPRNRWRQRTSVLVKRWR